jgi:NTP pyrophosphatase (non-canonical NTP hydrolase)
VNSLELREAFGPRTQDTTKGFLKRLTQWAHKTSSDKGFWKKPEMMDKYVAKLALIHSEVTEVLEALRKRQGADKVTEEFADIFIRAYDLHEKLVADGEATDDLQETIIRKMEANEARPALHGHRWG